MFIAQRLRSWSIILSDQLCLRAHDGVQMINEWDPLEMNGVSGSAAVSSYRWSSELQGHVRRNLCWKDPPPSAWCHCRAAYPLSQKQSRVRNRAAEGVTRHVTNAPDLTNARLISGRTWRALWEHEAVFAAVPGVRRITDMVMREQTTRMTSRAIAIPFQFLWGGLMPDRSFRDTNTHKHLISSAAHEWTSRNNEGFIWVHLYLMIDESQWSE